MMQASLRIQRQLEDTEGCVRFASIVTAPREFWTISIWSSRHQMQEFMRSGAHQALMWNFSHWFESFWLMRWAPTNQEAGDWSGVSLADDSSQIGASAERASDPLCRTALGGIPDLLGAIGPGGMPSLDHAPLTRRARTRLTGGTGVMVRMEVDRMTDLIRVLRSLRRLQDDIVDNEDVLGITFGVANSREVYALGVFGKEDPSAAFSRSARRLVENYGTVTWMMQWDAEHEFGHWDGLRLRRLVLRAGAGKR